jgi:hypothetical protein
MRDADGEPRYVWDDFERFNKGAIVAGNSPFQKPTTTPVSPEDKDKDEEAKRRAKDLEDKEQDKAMSDIFFNGTKVPASFRASNIEDDDDMDAVNESIFKDIYKNYMKRKLFETIHENAQKRG